MSNADMSSSQPLKRHGSAGGVVDRPADRLAAELERDVDVHEPRLSHAVADRSPPGRGPAACVGSAGPRTVIV
jgi:hypothetical protein